MIDWIDEKCKVWGKQVRKRAIGKAGQHEEGWPSVSVLGKIKEEWEGAGHRGGGKPVQPIFSGFMGDALDVHRAIFHPRPMRFELYAALKLHYCLRAPVKIKVNQLHLITGKRHSVAEYWNVIDRAHHFLEARMYGLESTAQQVAESV